MSIPTRLLKALPALLALVLLAGCNASFAKMARGVDTVPGGGNDGIVHLIRLDDVYVWAPHSVPTGGDAPLHVELSNATHERDELVGVTAGGVRQVELRWHGRRVHDIAVPAEGQTNLEWHTDLLLDGARTRLHPGDTVPVTFHFAHAGTITISAMLEPTYPGWYR